jgi:hypothetical protein
MNFHLGAYRLCKVSAFALLLVLEARAAFCLEATQETRSDMPRLYFDRAHGQAPVPEGMTNISNKLKLQILSFEQPISADGLRGSSLLYLRAPSKPFTEEEKNSIIQFVERGGSLLLVLDEERRQNLQLTGVNDLITPFGMRLTADTAYVPNPGAIALAGEINRSDREIPYDGGRAIEGGKAFAFQLDKAGKPAQPYAAWQRIEGGGRIVVMAEGMASLFLGSPNGRRLTAVLNGGDASLYWGKDSAIFMEEVLSWLVHKGAQTAR